MWLSVHQLCIHLPIWVRYSDIFVRKANVYFISPPFLFFHHHQHYLTVDKKKKINCSRQLNLVGKLTLVSSNTGILIFLFYRYGTCPNTPLCAQKSYLFLYFNHLSIMFFLCQCELLPSLTNISLHFPFYTYMNKLFKCFSLRVFTIPVLCETYSWGTCTIL